MLKEDAIANEIIDIEIGDWDRALIYQLFNPTEAEIICRVPISRGRAEDKMVWCPTRNGMFTVKSAYHLELQRTINQTGECSVPSRNSMYWKSIWQLQCPSFVKHFMWKACQDVLPTNLNQIKKSVLQSPWCPICSREEESTINAL